MAFCKFLAMPAMTAVLAALTATTPAQAALELTLQSGANQVQLNGTSLPDGTSSIVYGGFVGSPSAFPNVLSISLVAATSNSAINGPGVVSNLDITSFVVTNLTGQTQTLVISASDEGFSPDSASRPLGVFNTASGTFGGLTGGSLMYQTFAYDGTGYFQSSGVGVVPTDQVVVSPLSSGGTTTATFTPTQAPGDLFSLTGVLTITLAPYASVSGSADSLAHAPEPGGTALVGSGVVALAIGHRLRRRRTGC